jgi:NitT/TauT family transport system permease protein
MKALRYFITFLCLIIVWIFLSRFFGSKIIPGPLSVALYFAHHFCDPGLYQHFLASGLRILLSLVLSFSLAFPLGLILGVKPKIDRIISPFIFITYPIPKILLLPILLILLGLGELPKIILVSLTIGYQILVVIRDSLLHMDQRYLDSFESLYPGHKKNSFVKFLSQTKHLFLPAAFPSTMTVLRLASGTAVAVLFMAESFATEKGLGFMIIDAWGGMDMPRMFAGIVCMCFLGLFLYELANILEYFFCPGKNKANHKIKTRELIF